MTQEEIVNLIDAIDAKRQEAGDSRIFAECLRRILDREILGILIATRIDEIINWRSL